MPLTDYCYIYIPNSSPGGSRNKNLNSYYPKLNLSVFIFTWNVSERIDFRVMEDLISYVTVTS